MTICESPIRFVEIPVSFLNLSLSCDASKSFSSSGKLFIGQECSSQYDCITEKHIRLSLYRLYSQSLICNNQVQLQIESFPVYLYFDVFTKGIALPLYEISKQD